tara:strand:+ start:2546 stop:3664 length:1119 start_codon:yes stop_codon:yes gene_type:complete
MINNLKHIIDYISAPTISFTLITVLFPFIFPPTDWFDRINRKLRIYKLWTNLGGFILFSLVTSFFVLGYNDPNFKIILMKGDNFPIVLMIYSMFFFTWYAMKKSYINDARLDRGEKPTEYHDPDDKVLVWPDLVYIEFIALILFMVFLIVWSILVAAPLEEPANPASTPNPSKAPWYFLGLQEMLVYFDPWLAGVLFPTLIILGMCAIPYMDINKKGDGYYSFKERRVGYFIFLYGWLVLWVYLIIIGTFFRGPNWNFFGPFEYWDPHKIVPLNNINLSEYFWVIWLKQPLPGNILLRESMGFIITGIYVIVLPLLLAKTILKDMYRKYGPTRFTFLMILGLSMLSLPIKMYLRWIFNLKYIIGIPEWFFNI